MNIWPRPTKDACSPGSWRVASHILFQQFPFGRETKGQHCWQGDHIQRASSLNRNDTMEIQKLPNLHIQHIYCLSLS